MRYRLLIGSIEVQGVCQEIKVLVGFEKIILIPPEYL